MKDVQDIKRSIEKELNYLIDITSLLKEKLRSLDENQITAVNVLLWQIQSVTRGSRILGKRGEIVLGQFNAELVKICPDFPKVELPSDLCLEAEIGYVSALKKCEDKGIREEKCYDAHVYLGTLAECAMAKIENLRGLIEKNRDDLGFPKQI